MSGSPVDDFQWSSAPNTTFGLHVLGFDCQAACEQIEAELRNIISRQLRRRGAIVAVSGGVDSAVCLGLAVRSLGPDRVLALLLPERDSDADSTAHGEMVCRQFGIDWIQEDIAPALDALGCYRRRDDAIRKLVPEFGSEWRCKIAVAPNLLESDRMNYFTLTVESPDGTQQTKRMPADVYLAVVASTNMKQRTRKLLEYHHAERLNYAVLGTPNRLEYEQGFFVRGGDGLADVKPIACLYKTQVYALAKFLGIPDEICSQLPSTDTYSLPQTQEEFFFALPYDQMDLFLYAHNHGVSVSEVAHATGLAEVRIERVFRDIEAKKRTAKLLSQDAVLVEVTQAAAENL